MLSDKSVLLERIHVAINEKWCQKSCENSDLFNKNFFAHSPMAATTEKMEQRLQALEKQNDQMLYLINFLVENLPDLVINILHGDWEKNGAPAGALKYGDDVYPTRREQDVLELLVKGFCAKEIANELFISETTVITHKKNLKEKFNARNTVELISKAQNHLARRPR